MFGRKEVFSLILMITVFLKDWNCAEQSGKENTEIEFRDLHTCFVTISLKKDWIPPLFSPSVRMNQKYPI